MTPALFLWNAPRLGLVLPPLTLREVLLVHDRLPAALLPTGNPRERDEIHDVLIRRGLIAAAECDPPPNERQPAIAVLGEHEGLRWGRLSVDDRFVEHLVECVPSSCPVSPALPGPLPIPCTMERMVFRARRFRVPDRSPVMLLLADDVDPARVAAAIDHHVLYPPR